MKQENYTYPALFDYAEEGTITIRFLDFEECVTYAEADREAVKCATDILGLTLVNYEQQGIPMPEPAAVSQVQVGAQQKLVFINIWMPYFRNQVKEIYVKKTLTIPAWLDILAKQNNLNFSSILVQGLKAALQIDQ